MFVSNSEGPLYTPLPGNNTIISFNYPNVSYLVMMLGFFSSDRCCLVRGKSADNTSRKNMIDNRFHVFDDHYPWTISRVEESISTQPGHEMFDFLSVYCDRCWDFCESSVWLYLFPLHLDETETVAPCLCPRLNLIKVASAPCTSDVILISFSPSIQN